MKNISIRDIETAIKEIFTDSEAFETESVYETIDNSKLLKLIIPFEKMYLNNSFNIVYSKLVFLTDSEKMTIQKNTFLYLYDINSEYSKVNFEDIEDFKEKLLKIFTELKFGKDIRIISEFLKHPSMSMNDWLSKNSHSYLFSITNVEYEPTKAVIDGFDFVITVSNIGEVKLNIQKISDKEYKYLFKFNSGNKTIMRRNLNGMIATITQEIKNNLT